MRHHNIVLHQIQKHVPWSVFDRLVDEHKADHRVRKLTTKSQLLALLFGQLAGAVSLREIEAGLASQQSRLYHVGGRGIARSTLAEANARRPAAVFSGLFAHIAATTCRRTRRHISDAVRILDATRIELSSLRSGWADMVSGHRAIKLHVNYNPHADAPLGMTLTGQRVNDITPAKALMNGAGPVEPGMTYVFDLAYYDFAWWAELDATGCRIVTRLKTRTKLEVTAEQAVPGGDSAILSDRIGLLPRRMARSRKNPFADPVREITVRIATGKIIRILTNDLDAPASEIAHLYKQRWQIELFFKWIKRNLKIRHFLGTSENAVRIQIFVALIAYLLLRMAQACQSAVKQPLAFTRLVRLNLMHRRPITELTQPRPKPSLNQDQMVLI
ncbi:IS4 family transposase [Microbaculum marinum]|uniref:IS4 family transposase n=1 Tax=Microbaculum marinum TaxID=1764581 RepID=A0AAW9RZ01_9HYPH